MKKILSRKVLVRTVIAIAALSLFAWSPWLTPVTTAWLARTQLNAAWSFVMDGCGAHQTPPEAGFEKVPFGARTTIDYQCGLLAPEEPYRQARVFVSFLGTAHGYPAPWHAVRQPGQATPSPAVPLEP